MKDRCPGHIEGGTCPLLSRSEPETGIKETGKFPFVIASKAPVIASEAPVIASEAKQSLHLPYGIASSLTLLAMTKALKGNTKHKARNSKQIQMTEVKNSKQYDLR